MTDECEHGTSYDFDCGPCDDMTDLLRSFGAETPREIGIAERALKAGRAEAPEVEITSGHAVGSDDQPLPRGHAMTEHQWTLEEYDALHASVGLAAEWLSSDRRRETEREISCGVGPGGLKRPMMGCGYVDQVDGCCTHPLNFTPECHQGVTCPVLELR